MNDSSKNALTSKFGQQLSYKHEWNKKAFFYSMILFVSISFTACQKELANDLKNQPLVTENASKDKPESADKMMSTDFNFIKSYSGLSSQTAWELQQARSATARYRKLANAIKDGYSDINVIVPNMGYHYMKSTLADATFDVRNPEILVYNKTDDGGWQLLAVEYAVPISLSPNNPPEGFTGRSDEWEYNTTFGLWLCHAWVWDYNPDGVFSPTNPLVELK